MIAVDISNVWGELSLPDLLTIEKEVSDAHMLPLPGNISALRDTAREIERILKAAEAIRKCSDVCVVVGTGSGCLGARAAMDLLQGPHRNLSRRAGEPRILFTGTDFSTRAWNELTELLEEQDFSVIVISGTSFTPEAAVALRGLRWLLDRRYGTDEASRRIYAVAAPGENPLGRMAAAKHWEYFPLPAGDQGSVLSPAGLLPMAVAGIDIRALLAGAMEAEKEYDLRSFENPVWLYAGVRNALYRKGRTIELMEGFDPGFRSFGRWWQQRFGEAEGRDGTGLFPAAAELPSNLPALEPRIGKGPSRIFETMVHFDPPEREYVIVTDWQDPEELGYLEGKTLAAVDAMAREGILAAHGEAGIPMITMDCGPLTEGTLGELFYFLELSCAVSAGVSGEGTVDPNGKEVCKTNMFRLLGKPGYEF